MIIETVTETGFVPSEVQAVIDAVCDECAGDGQLAYDLQARMWVPRGAAADWPAEDCIGISVLDCLQCAGTGMVLLEPRDVAVG